MTVLWITLALCSLGTVVTADVNQTNDTSVLPKDSRALFSPRVDYAEWLPLGRGDPLKNDPTFDYVPPVLDRVRYWADNKPADKSDILLLGVPSKKPSIRKEMNDPFMKFVDAPKFSVTPRRHYYPIYTVLMPPPMQTKPDTTMPQTSFPYSYQSTPSPYSIWGPTPVPPSSLVSNWRAPPPGGGVRKGVVSDAAGELSSYVNIGKPSAVVNHNPTYPPYHMEPSTMNTIINNQRRPFIHTLLQKESTPTTVTVETSPAIMISSTSYTSQKPITTMTSVSQVTETVETTTKVPTTPEAPPLTTDPFFSHYNQPAQPIRGPMYLIIQGHSKVKTYGSKPDSMNQLTADTVKHLHVKNEGRAVIKHLHPRDEERIDNISVKDDKSDEKTLENLIDSKPSDLSDELGLIPEDDILKRGGRELFDEISHDHQETEVKGSYNVGNLTVEPIKYRKGIVETYLSNEHDILD